MEGTTDALDLLVDDVRKNIRENQKFLQLLADDTDDGTGGLAESDEAAEEEFEEL